MCVETGCGNHLKYNTSNERTSYKVHFTSLIWRWFLIQLSTNWVFYYMLKTTYFNSILLGIDICIHHLHIHICVYLPIQLHILYMCMYALMLCGIVQQITRAYYLRPVEWVTWMLVYFTYFSLRFLYQIGITAVCLEIKCKFVYFEFLLCLLSHFLLISFQIMIKLLFGIMRVCHFAVVKCKSKYSLYFICIYRVSYMGF